MQIIERAKGNASDIVPPNVSEKDVKEEVNRRAAKAGYTTKYGEPTHGTKIMGSVLMGEQKLNVWPRDEQGNLIGD